MADDAPDVTPASAVAARAAASSGDARAAALAALELDTVALETAAPAPAPAVDLGPRSWKQWTWSVVKGGAYKVANWADFVGEVMVHMMGLDQSRYQWVIDSMEQDKLREEQREREERQREMLRERAAKAAAEPSNA